MSIFIIVFCLLIFSFFIGAIPTGYLLVKTLIGRDIRTLGSGNIGSTNVRRAAGMTASLITQIADILKGTIPVVVALLISRHLDFGNARMAVLGAIALASILGHDFSPLVRVFSLHQYPLLWGGESTIFCASLHPLYRSVLWH
jgi:glycerol-3-phosphate acyltransferase PlsY